MKLFNYILLICVLAVNNSLSQNPLSLIPDTLCTDESFPIEELNQSFNHTCWVSNPIFNQSPFIQKKSNFLQKENRYSQML